jgi:phage I-like protein
MENKIKKLLSRIEIGEDFAEKQKTPMSEIEVLTEGYWKHPEYGDIEITPEDIDKFVQNFNDKTRKIDIAVDQEHKPDLGAAGWFRELKKVVEDGITKLKAKVEWTAMGKDLLSNGIYKYFSPEFDFEYEDFETHDMFENVLLGGALTNRPYFKSLAPVQLSENVFISLKKGGENKMTKEEIKAKLVADSKFVLSENSSDEERKFFDEVQAEVTKEAEELKAKEDADKAKAENEEEGESQEAEAKKEAEEKEKTDNEALKATEKLDAKEFNDLKSKIGILETKLKFKEVGEKIQGYVFSESNPDGKLLPKSNEVAQKLLMSLSERQGKLFEEFMASLPVVSKVLFSELGGDEGKSLEASEEAVKKADELAEKKGITFGQALKDVYKNNPELAKKL